MYYDYKLRNELGKFFLISEMCFGQDKDGQITETMIYRRSIRATHYRSYIIHITK